MVDSDGKHVRRPTSGFDNDHAWSPDGRRIAYSGYDRNDRNDRGHL